MDEIPYRTKVNQRVRLKGDAEPLYGLAYTGSPGWVRGHKRDDLGYPLVRIEWDKDWWGYNGEKDRWALEAHFDIVEEPKVSNGQFPDEVLKAMAALGQFAAAQAGGAESAQPEQGQPTSAPEPTNPAEAKVFGTTDEDYAKVVASALDFAAEADSVVVVAVKKSETPKGTALEPRMFAAHKDPQAVILLEMQLSKIAAAAHQDAGYMALQSLEKKGEE